MTLQRWGLPLLIASSALMAWSAMVLQVNPILRAPLVFIYVLIGTGMGWIRLLNIGRGIAEWTLAIALSLAIAALTSIGMLYAGQWSPEQWLALLAILGAIGALLAGWYNPQPKVEIP